MSYGFAGVVIPHVTDDQGRLFRIPTDRLLDRQELTVVFAFLCWPGAGRGVAASPIDPGPGQRCANANCHNSL